MIDLKKLRELSDKANTSEDWFCPRHLALAMDFEEDCDFAAYASPAVVLELLDQLEAAQKQVDQYRVYDGVIAEIDRRADKEWCLGDQCDFTVTITYEQYLAINAAQSSQS